MKKVFFILVSAIILICIELTAFKLIQARNLQSAKDKKAYLSPIVRLVRDGHTFCSGVVINTHTIITAAHCVIVNTPFGSGIDPDLVIEIRADNNLPINNTATVLWAYTQTDTAVLTGNFQYITPAKYISDILELNSKIRNPYAKLTSCGYALGGRLTCSEGHYIGPDGFAVKITNILIPGMSGGPTMLEDGTVVAINNAVDESYSIVMPIYLVDKLK